MKKPLSKKAFRAPKVPPVVKKDPDQEAPLFPMRINKYLAHKNFSTRRGADELIEKKRVLINGQLASLGDKVAESDIVEVKGKGKPTKYVYLAYNKPVGVITHAQNKGERDIVRSLKFDDPSIHLFPIGRLDKNSHGLIILTNDGRITDRLLNPDHAHEKEYEVKSTLPLRNNFKEKMENGVNIEGYVTKKCKVTILNEKTFRVLLTEGKKHQIRRMLSALFNDVYDLKRTSILNIKLGNIKQGEYRHIKDDELKIFLTSLGL